jgi:hypothetical protein
MAWDEAKAYWPRPGHKLAEWLDEAGRGKMKLAAQTYRESLWTVQQRARRKRHLVGRTRSAVVARVGNVEPSSTKLLINNDHLDADGGL